MNLNKSLVPSMSIIHQPCFKKMKDHQKLHKIFIFTHIETHQQLVEFSHTHAYQLFLNFCMLTFRTHVVFPHKHPEMYTLGLFGGLHTFANHQILKQTTYHNALQHHKSCIYHTQPTIFQMTISTHGSLATHTSQNT